MWGKIIIPMYRLWLHGLYGLYGPHCPLSPERPLNFHHFKPRITRTFCGGLSILGFCPVVYWDSVFLKISFIQTSIQTFQIPIILTSWQLKHSGFYISVCQLWILNSYVHDWYWFTASTVSHPCFGWQYSYQSLMRLSIWILYFMHCDTWINLIYEITDRHNIISWHKISDL